jgi:hypothetical protein
MNAATGHSGPVAQGGPRGGLPEDDDLAVFKAAVEGALGPGTAPVDRKTPLTAVPAVATDREDDGPPAAGTQAGLAVTDAQELPDIPHGNLIRQATINVAAGVAERFRAYQRQQAAEGPAPSNAEVVFRALEACRGRYAEVVASRRPQAEPGRLFGAPVAGRRVSSEARLSSQINYRPTYAEVAEIKRLGEQAGAQSVSAFLDAVLDEFLPKLPGRPRSRNSR